MAITTAQQRRSAVWQSLPAPSGTLDSTDRREILWQYGIPIGTRYLGLYGTWTGEPVLGSAWQSMPVLVGAWDSEPVVHGDWNAVPVATLVGTG
jgi:hypothetical protein